MFLLVALCVIVPIIEIAVFVQVAHWIGGWEALFVLGAVSLLGVSLVKVQGVGVVRRVRDELGRRSVPGRSLIDGLLILAAAALLLFPGFLTAALGLLLLVPAVRVPVRELLVRRWSRSAVVRVAASASARTNAIDVHSSVGRDRPRGSETQELGRHRAIEPGGEPDGVV